MALYDRFTADEKIMMSATDVVGHVIAENDVRRAEAEAAGATFYTLPVVPLEGQFPNVYEYELYRAECEYSDMYKEVYGRRPQLNDWRTGKMRYTLTELEEEIDFLCTKYENLINM